MKKLILILLLLKGCVAFAQSDTIYAKDMPYTLSNGRSIEIDTAWLKYSDTIPVLMLVTDTGYATTNEIINADSLYAGKTYLVGIYQSKPSPIAYYLIGYEVRQESDLIYLHWLGEEDSNNPIMQHKEYLDTDKQPLPKNVVVWQSQNLK